MEGEEQIKLVKEFLETRYLSEITEAVRKGEYFILVDFNEITKFSPELADELLERPEDIFKAAEMVIKDFDLPKEVSRFYLRLTNLPTSQKIMISEIRSQHLNKFLWTEGVIKTKSEVRPHVITARFECPSCGNLINILQLDKQFREPSRCACGRKGKFREISKELIDAQGLVLEEAPEDLEGGEQPKRIHIFLKGDLVSPLNEKRSAPGTKIRVIGRLVEVPLPLRGGGKSTKFDLMIEANNLELIGEDFLSLKMSKEEKERFKNLAQDPRFYEKITASIAPSIYGHERIKEVLALQLVGGVKKTRSDGVVTRGDIHVLLIGDPGSGKSQLLKRISQLAPKGRYTSGKGVSGAGLTATVLRDEMLGGFSLEAGAMVLANKGVVCIDELDKMDTDDRAALHEALEQQQVSISKANIQATLRAETTVLAAANPKFGRFDPTRLVADQIDLPPTLINRFDLIFPIKDIPNKETDEKMADYILLLHQKPEEIRMELDNEFLRKYIAYARQEIKPKLGESALKELKDYFVKVRGRVLESETKAIPITARQLEGLIRLAEAYAKLRLSNKITKKDAQRAIEILHYCLTQIAQDIETGEIDIDRLATGVSTSQRNKIILIKETIDEITKETGQREIPYELLFEACQKKGLKTEEVESILEKLRRSGDLFEPKKGFIQKL